MDDHAHSSSYANFIPLLKRLFASKLEPERRPVEDVFVASQRTTFTLQQNRNWLRAATEDLVEHSLVVRIRPGGHNTSVTHLLLTAKGKGVLGGALSKEQQDMASRVAKTTDRQAPATPPRRDEPTFDGLRRDIKRFCELHGCQIEWTMINRDGASAGE